MQERASQQCGCVSKQGTPGLTRKQNQTTYLEGSAILRNAHVLRTTCLGLYDVTHVSEIAELCQMTDSVLISFQRHPTQDQLDSALPRMHLHPLTQRKVIYQAWPLFLCQWEGRYYASIVRPLCDGRETGIGLMGGILYSHLGCFVRQ